MRYYLCKGVFVYLIKDFYKGYDYGRKMDKAVCQPQNV